MSVPSSFGLWHFSFMYLKRLDITGFKSFAQHTTLEFDRGLASIVGPNGSGKSNVADAIRWVLGEQSMKLLRGKKSDDVIFSGSHLKARLGMAEVSLWLNNEDRQMPVDYSEVVITRRVYRNGEGEYFLNKNAIRLQDIHLLLAKSNIGQKSYSVIGQGMIDHVLVATPAERKIFFDEAAGVRQYQIKREQAVSKLEQTKDNLNQAQMLLSEIEPRLRTLTRQVRRLERRGAVEQELRATQERYYSQRHVELATELAAYEKTLTEQRTEQQHHENALAELQAELEQLEKERTRHEAFQELQSEYSRVLEQKNAVMKEQVVLDGSEELAAAKSGELNTVWLTNRSRELERELSSLREESSTLEKETAVQQSNREAKGRELSSVIKKMEGLQQQVDALRSQTDKTTDFSALQKDFSVLHEEFVAFQHSVETAESEQHWISIKRNIRRVAEKLSGLVKRLQNAKGQDHARDLLALQEEFQTLIGTKDVLVNELNTLERQEERRSERIALLHESQQRLNDERERVLRELERLQPGAKAGTTTTQRKTLDEQLRSFDKQLQSLREKIVNFNQEEQKKKEHLFSLQKAFRHQQNELSGATTKVNATRVEQAKRETRKDDLAHEIRSELPGDAAERIIALTENSSVDRTESDEKLLVVINEFKHQLELIGGIDEGVTEEFKMTDERHGFLAHQVDDLVQSIAHLEQVIQELDATIKDQFHKSFTIINREFSKYFKVLFNGGNAKLVLLEVDIPVGETLDEDDDDGEEQEEKAPKKKGKTQRVIAGVDIIAAPPGKRISGIAMLSGGERAMTSIALICGILSNRPSPFVVLDEVDAALDEANTQRFAAILKELATKTQFITITHNRSTMQISSLLYGITMSDDGISKLLSIKMEEAEHVIAQHGNRK